MINGTKTKKQLGNMYGNGYWTKWLPLPMKMASPNEAAITSDYQWLIFLLVSISAVNKLVENGRRWDRTGWQKGKMGAVWSDLNAVVGAAMSPCDTSHIYIKYTESLYIEAVGQWYTQAIRKAMSRSRTQQSNGRLLTVSARLTCLFKRMEISSS